MVELATDLSLYASYYFGIAILILTQFTVLVIGFSTGLVGYDAALISPLISLPQFVERYQGGTGGNNAAFTVREPLNFPIVVLTGIRHKTSASSCPSH